MAGYLPRVCGLLTGNACDMDARFNAAAHIAVITDSFWSAGESVPRQLLPVCPCSTFACTCQLHCCAPLHPRPPGATRMQSLLHMRLRAPLLCLCSFRKPPVGCAPCAGCAAAGAHDPGIHQWKVLGFGHDGSQVGATSDLHANGLSAQ